MHKIALISDIHANLPALESCLVSVYAHRPDAVYCLGDLVGYNVWPNEVIQLIRKHRIPVIKGNYDEGVGNGSDDCGCFYKTEEEKQRGKKSVALTNALIGPDERAYLRTLPSHFSLDFHYGESSYKILMVHGSPRRINEYLFEDRDEDTLRRLMTTASADILCFGHTHKPYHRVIQENNDSKISYKHAINTGSVGKPKDGNPNGSWVLLEVDPEKATWAEEAVQVHIVHFAYNVEKAARAIEQSEFPDEFANMLRTGN